MGKSLLSCFLLTHGVDYVYLINFIGKWNLVRMRSIKVKG